MPQVRHDDQRNRRMVQKTGEILPRMRFAVYVGAVQAGYRRGGKTALECMVEASAAWKERGRRRSSVPFRGQKSDILSISFQDCVYLAALKRDLQHFFLTRATGRTKDCFLF